MGQESIQLLDAQDNSENNHELITIEEQTAETLDTAGIQQAKSNPFYNFLHKLNENRREYLIYLAILTLCNTSGILGYWVGQEHTKENFMQNLCSLSAINNCTC